MNKEKSFEYCRKIAKSHYENFPVGLFVPKEIRKYVYTIYTFARTADDFADDENLSKTQRLALLDAYQSKLIDCYKDISTDPVFDALNITRKKFNISINLFESLLFAFKMDVEKDRFLSFTELIHYSTHSANPIGRLILILSEVKNEIAYNQSDCICTALQLTNFWQDITIDLRKNRIYLPQEDMRTYNYSEKELFEKSFNDRFRALLKYEIQKTEQLFKNGAPLVNQLSGRLKFEIILIVLGGMKIITKIKNLDYNVLASRPCITKLNKITLLLNALFIWIFRKKLV